MNRSYIFICKTSICQSVITTQQASIKIMNGIGIVQVICQSNKNDEMTAFRQTNSTRNLSVE